MKCLVCHSETDWLETIMDNEYEGYEAYVCKDCGSRTEYGIKVVEVLYTGKDNVFPNEQERDC